MDKLPLSQLIRIGAKLRPQCVSWTINKQGHTCAIGAAVMAKTGEEPPGLTVECAKILGIEGVLMADIIHQNDSLGFTREEIAQHLEEQGL